MNLLQFLGHSGEACFTSVVAIALEGAAGYQSNDVQAPGSPVLASSGDKLMRCSMQLFKTGSAREVGSHMLAGAGTVALAADRRQVLLHIDTVNAALGLLINLAEGSSTHRQSLQTLQIAAQPIGSSQGTTAVGLLARLMQVWQSHLPASCLIGGQALCWRPLLLLLLHGLACCWFYCM